MTNVTYRESQKDCTPIKVEILRGCWVALAKGAPAVALKPGQILELPRWLADVLLANRKATPVHRSFLQFPRWFDDEKGKPST